ncbi:hypothetical protein AAC387_Pa02g1147 [Persea americana]
MKADQTRSITGIRGTRGYVSPEWFKDMPITAKVDVYSFGVLLLEIICCRRNLEMGLENEERAILTDWAYDCYAEMRLDLLVENDEDAKEDLKRVERMVMVAIWCIQENPTMRPGMMNVTEMLEGVVEPRACAHLASIPHLSDPSLSRPPSSPSPPSAENPRSPSLWIPPSPCAEHHPPSTTLAECCTSLTSPLPSPFASLSHVHGLPRQLILSVPLSQLDSHSQVGALRVAVKESYHRVRARFPQQPPRYTDGAHAQAQATFQVTSGAQVADDNNLLTQPASSPGTEQADDSKNPSRPPPRPPVHLWNGLKASSTSKSLTTQYLSARNLSLFQHGLKASSTSKSLTTWYLSARNLSLFQHGLKASSTSKSLTILSLSRDIIHNILEKIPAPIVDLLNPFSVLEHSSVIEPVFSYSLSKNLLEAAKNASNPFL